MLNTVFMITVGLYFVSTLVCFAGAAFKRKGQRRAAPVSLFVSTGLHGVCIVRRGVAARRLPLGNRFESVTARVWFAVPAFVFVMFAFVGVNALMSGLYSYV